MVWVIEYVRPILKGKGKAVLPGLVKYMVTQTPPGSAPTESGFV